MFSAEIRIAFLSVAGAAIGVIGVLAGAWIAASSAEKVAIAQIESQRILARSEVAMKLLDYAGAPIADIYTANVRLQQFDLSTMDEAARQLAIASAVGAARIGGEVAVRSLALSKSADEFGKIPLSETNMKIAAAGKIGVAVTGLMYAYNDYRKVLQNEILPPSQ